MRPVAANPQRTGAMSVSGMRPVCRAAVIAFAECAGRSLGWVAMTPYAFPASAEKWPTWIDGAVDERLRRVRGLVDDVRRSAPDQVLELWNELELALGDADALVST